MLGTLMEDIWRYRNNPVAPPQKYIDGPVWCTSLGSSLQSRIATSGVRNHLQTRTSYPQIPRATPTTLDSQTQTYGGEQIPREIINVCFISKDWQLYPGDLEDGFYILLSDNNIEMILGMSFHFFSNPDTHFAKKDLVW